MQINRKWLVRGGALLIIFGFFMPSMLVSCSAMPTANQVVSLSQLANQSDGGQPILYLVLLGALVTIVFSFLSAEQNRQWTLHLVAQILGIGLGAVSIIVTFLSLSSQMQQIGFSIKPTFGLYFLLVGYVAAIVGIVMQYLGIGGLSIPHMKTGAEPLYLPVEQPKPLSKPPIGPHLEVLKGIPNDSPVFIFDGFIIGRGSSADLSLPDRSVSAQHVRFRFAQGYWFIQDQGSANGIIVNGKQESAIRLNSGDKIKIGNTTFIFRN